MFAASSVGALQEMADASTSTLPALDELVRASYGGLADRVVFYASDMTWITDLDHCEHLGATARAITRPER